MSDSFWDVVRRQRACRRYSDQPVDDETVERILTAATFAPSSENFQPWHFVVVRDPERRGAIGEHLRQRWEGGRGLERAIKRVPITLAEDVDHGQRGGLAGAPVLVVVAGDTTRVPMAWMASSIYPAVQNILLAATAAGLGSAMATLVTEGDALANIIELPEGVVAMAMIPLGHPAKTLGPPRREPFDEHTSRERYGQPWRCAPEG
jgi:nitroreductase